MDLDKRFSEMFIEKIKRRTDYHFIIINQEGFIIAATEKERVGVFHEASYVMMRNGIDMIVVRPEELNNYLGAKPGIDVPIIIEGETIGALGITGIAEEVRPIVTVVKMTIESMLEYEILKEKTNKKNSEREAFFSLLLSERMGKSDQLINMAHRLGYSPDVMRVAIVFIIEGANSTTVSQIMESEKFTNQDFAFLNKESEVVVFHRLKEKPEQLLSTYRQSVKEFLEPICREFSRYKIGYKYYIGSMQNNLNNYFFAYAHCGWLSDNDFAGEFFYNHIEDYVKDQIPILELSGIYQAVLSLFENDMVENYAGIVSVLERNNYNLVSSSKELFLHKNTLIFRLNKIRDFMDLNPIQNADDRAFMDYLSFYIGVQQKYIFKTDRRLHTGEEELRSGGYEA